ncbi:MAG: carboxypeptidase regulatory-like domain-containing protein [Bacteroidales bacterium]|nr:carboxypeptidase regulatory-like domain-containing protein [Bacteroidales bacterium]MDZ4204175.1 carboxypeptidase regulatory-like domain-containing protein [Bacteroidales bacterium]
MKKRLFISMLAFLLAFGWQAVYAQGVTTGSISGTVVDVSGSSLPSATVLAVHEPSGTRYGSTTMLDGRFNIIGMRVGGPYLITVSFIGFESQSQGDVQIGLGETSNFNFVLRDIAAMLGEIEIVYVRDGIFSANRTGASTSIGQNAITKLPTLSRSIGDFTRLTPQASGSSFAGQDNRLNNITVDGSYFNNSFGLAGQPGDRTGVAPISLSAIEQIVVNIAPYDVRQGNFVGAGINTVTKSGTNTFKGEAYYNFRNSNMVGRQAKELSIDPGTFKFNQLGLSLGGPIIKNKLFFFADFGQETLESPGTTFLANTGGQTVAGNITRVLASDLNTLSTYLREKFSYVTGPYQGYMHETPALRFIGKIDWNINDRNKFSIRYNHLDSDTDVLLSNSSSLGWGTRRSNLTGLNFQNSNYQIMENIRSIIGELNTRIGDNMSNNLILGYTYQDESRTSRGSMFPMVDILNGGTVYTTFGFEPFTPNNELRYGTYQLQNNFTIFKNKHTLTFGLSAERYESENIFFPGSQGIYIYNSLADFYTDANDYIANPNRTASPITLRRFQVRWSNIPGKEIPVQPLQVFYAGIYGQDEWQLTSQLKLTGGLRIDVPFFGEVEYRNQEVETMKFLDENSDTVRYATNKLPDPKPLWSPRLGFNWDVIGNRSTQVRGGSGVFTGRPAYVWISNQVGNNGILTGFEQLDDIKTRPFNPNPNAYKPTTVTGAPATSYELALTDPDFKFPQIWRSNIAVDQKLLWGVIGTLEFIYSRDVNGIYYINANLIKPTAKFVGPDNRLLYPGGTPNRINSKITSAIVLKNQNVGTAYNLAVSLEKPFSKGIYAKAAYSYGMAKNTVDPGSIAFGSWNNNQHPGNPNDPGIGFSANAAGHRAFVALTYTTPSATTFSLFAESRNAGNFSYVFSGDLNRDGGTSNDLIYIHKDQSEMNFYPYSISSTGSIVTYNPSVTTNRANYSAQNQQDAWEVFITQDNYLRKNRGKYAERGAVFLPMVTRVDFSVSHDFKVNIAGSKNAFQVRMDFINVGNMLNKNWGVAERFIVNNPLIVRPTITGGTPATSGPVDPDGKPIYRLANIGNALISTTTQQSLLLTDVYRIQFGVMYLFN